MACCCVPTLSVEDITHLEPLFSTRWLGLVHLQEASGFPPREHSSRQNLGKRGSDLLDSTETDGSPRKKRSPHWHLPNIHLGNS